MSTQFQQYTSYVESLKLKELGMSQAGYDNDNRWWQNNCLTSHPVSGECALPEDGEPIRAYSFQEIVHYLMARYDFVQIGSAVETERDSSVVSILRSDMVWQEFSCDGRDPFPALYQALCWSLEQERETSSPS